MKEKIMLYLTLSLLCWSNSYSVNNNNHEYQSFVKKKPSDLYGGIAQYQIGFSERSIILPKDLKEKKQHLENWNQLVKLSKRYIDEKGTSEEKKILRRLDIINSKFVDSLALFHDIKTNPSSALILNPKAFADTYEKWKEYQREIQEIATKLTQQLDKEIPLPPSEQKKIRTQKISDIAPGYEAIIENYKKFKSGSITQPEFIASLPARSKFEFDDLIDNLRRGIFKQQSGISGQAKKLIFKEKETKLLQEIIDLLRTQYRSTTLLDTQKFGAATEQHKPLIILIGIAGILDGAINYAINNAPEIIKPLAAVQELETGVTRTQKALEKLKTAAEQVSY